MMKLFKLWFQIKLRRYIKACAEAMALTVWREAAAAGMSPALPAFVSFATTAARKALSSTVPEAGAAIAQMGILAAEVVRGGPCGATLMLRRKVGEMFEAAAMSLGPRDPHGAFCYNAALKAYRDMLAPRCLEALHRTGGFEAQTRQGRDSSSLSSAQMSAPLRHCMGSLPVASGVLRRALER